MIKNIEITALKIEHILIYIEIIEFQSFHYTFSNPALNQFLFTIGTIAMKIPSGFNTRNIS
ncbi:MAG: hypothetical protein RR422_07020, partial [Erysipelothrix sp.]